jgi:hypothetical protein
MNEELIEKAEAYALGNGTDLIERLGFGIHGIVFAEKSEDKPGTCALKMHHFFDPYARERDVYLRLQAAAVTRIGGLHVPQLLRWDDEWLALEITVVKPPFLLDFASAYLDFAPTFSDEVWEDWEIKNREEFGDDWPRAQGVSCRIGELRNPFARSVTEQYAAQVSGKELVEKNLAIVVPLAFFQNHSCILRVP